MNAFCLIVAGVVRAALPGPELVLAWDHSVEKSRWVERYRADAGSLLLFEASVRGLGAGMEPPPGAKLAGGGWTWHPATSLPELRLTHSRYTRDYTLCAGDDCRELATWTGAVDDGESVLVRACERAPAAPQPKRGAQ